MNIFTLLKADHAEAKATFEKLRKMKKIDEEELFLLGSKLMIHMELEEELFYPVLEDYDETAELAEESYVEHDEAKKIIREIKKGKLDNIELKTKCELLQVIITHHIDEEEGELFPKAKKVLSGEKVEAIGAAFEKQKEKRLEKV